MQDSRACKGIVKLNQHNSVAKGSYKYKGRAQQKYKTIMFTKG